MYRLMIVEDEDIEREALRDLVDWGSMEIEIAAVFESGEKALAFARNQKIDILLTDIRMIGMSGLELARELRKSYPELKVIITSGYQEFVYAKAAIDLDVYGYIAKPVELEELEKVFSRVIATCKVETESFRENQRLRQLIEQSKALLKEKFLTDLVDGKVSAGSPAEELKFYNICFVSELTVVILAELDGFDALCEEKPREDILMLVFKVLECIRNVKCRGCAETFYIGGGRYCTLFNTDAGGQKELHEKSVQLSRDIQCGVNDQCGLALTVGIGEWVLSLKDIHASFKKALEAVKFKFYMGGNQVIHCKDTYFNNASGINYSLDEIESRILSAVRLCDGETLEQCLTELFDLIKAKPANTTSYVRSVCIRLIARVSIVLNEMFESYEKIFGKEHLIWDKILKFDTILDLQQWMKNILGSVIEYISQSKKSSNKKVINGILKYIEDNYSRNITLTDIANEIFLSYNYISIIFKKEMGEGFSEYLVKYRLEKAKQMLKESNLKIYQISNMVGYVNISHFCSIFKSLYGVSPSEFREMA